MAFGRRREAIQPEETEVKDDPTGFVLDSAVANFLLMHTNEIKFMCLLGYTYLVGCKLFPNFQTSDPISFRIISLFMACFGGGILTPIFINGIPVVFSQDAFTICVMTSFLLHQYIPDLREIASMSRYVQVALIIMFETIRASVVVGLTAAAAKAIAPSFFDIPVFGPIFAGGIGGCGGAFMPLSKGLTPIQKTGLKHPMKTALAAAAYYHLFLNSSYSEGVIDAPKKAQVSIAIFFITHHIYHAFLEPKA